LKDQAGFDGVDLDWEENIDYTGFINLTAKLREVWPEAIITIPTQPAGLDANDFAPAKDYIDAFMPMSYLSFIQWGGWILPMPLTPIYNYSTNHYSIDTTLERWTTAGVSASKIITGIGGFGCVWGDNNPYDGVGPNKPYCSTLNSNPEGEVQALASDNIVTQKWLNELLNNNPSKLIETWDDIGKCSYWHSSSINRVDMAVSNFLGSDHYISLVFYETPRSISEKVDYINKNNMKGMMFWTLSQMIDENNSFPIVEHIVFK
jgi:GH18 family chitinase